MALSASESEINERLLRNVKKEVKQLMEESVTRKFVHEESSTITALCSAVEACLQYGLRKRSLGLFKNSNTTTALLQKVSKTLEPAAVIVRSLTEMEKNLENSCKSGENGSLSASSTKYPMGRKYNSKYLWIRLALFEKQLVKIIEYLVENSSKYYDKVALMSDPVDGMILASLLVGPCALEYTRMKTPDHYWTDPPADELVQRHRIRSSGSHYIPVHADSPKRPGLQMHKTASSSSEDQSRPSSATSAKEYVESLHQNAKSTLLYGKNNVVVQPKEDVEPLAGYLSLHQNADGLAMKWTPNQLMKGGGSEDEENNTTVDRRPIYARYASRNRLRSAGSNRRALYWDYAITVCIEDIVYLHCHQQPDCGGTVVFIGQDGVQRPPIHFPKGGHLMAFLSCLENGLLPRGQLDPPLWSQRTKIAGKVFPKLKQKTGPVAVLSSLIRTSVAEEVNTPPTTTALGASVDDVTSAAGGDEETSESLDYVFRIVYMQRPDAAIADAMDSKMKGKASDEGPVVGTYDWLVNSMREVTVQPAATDIVVSSSSAVADVVEQSEAVAVFDARTAVKQLCDTMKGQILSRAFYGSSSSQTSASSSNSSSDSSYHQVCAHCAICMSSAGPFTTRVGLTLPATRLSHCRHLKTVRTHLSGLVNPLIVSVDYPVNASYGVTREILDKMSTSATDDLVASEAEVYRHVYYGGCSPEIRQQVWPFLLGYYKFGSSESERVKQDASMRQQYERSMSEWLAIEAIIQQREREAPVASAQTTAAERTSDSQDGTSSVELPPAAAKIRFFRNNSSLSNDVFESIDGTSAGAGLIASCDDSNRPETVVEESSNATTPTVERSSVTTDGGGASEVGNGLPAPRPTASSERSDRVSTTEQHNGNLSPDDGLGSSIAATRLSALSDSSRRVDSCDTDRGLDDIVRPDSVSNIAETGDKQRNIFVTGATVDVEGLPAELATRVINKDIASCIGEADRRLSTSQESLVCPASPLSNTSNGGIYSTELLDSVALNLHRIDKDVHRCDRNNAYFATMTNLEKLRNIMCTYVWENLEVGYIQGMCDLLAPLLVIFDDEVKTYSCFCQLMKRMSINFPQGGAMDQHFGNMRSLIQILDPELFEHMRQNGDYTHFYFCYRWFLLDFKRELVYDDVFTVWETIWSAKHVSSPHFVLFIALALVEYYREIIIDNNMDFTDIIKFFNEMAERHNAKEVLQIARGLVHRLQALIENK